MDCFNWTFKSLNMRRRKANNYISKSARQIAVSKRSFMIVHRQYIKENKRTCWVVLLKISILWATYARHTCSPYHHWDNPDSADIGIIIISRILTTFDAKRKIEATNYSSKNLKKLKHIITYILYFCKYVLVSVWMNI